MTRIEKERKQALTGFKNKGFSAILPTTYIISTPNLWAILRKPKSYGKKNKNNSKSRKAPTSRGGYGSY